MNMSSQRVSAANDEDFVVFMVGMRFRVRQVKYLAGGLQGHDPNGERAEPRPLVGIPRR